MNIYTTTQRLPDFAQTTGGTAIALGLFDGVHEGHRRVIDTAISYGESLTPMVFTFTTKQLKPKGKSRTKNILTLPERLEAIAQIGIREVYLPDFSEIHDLTAIAFVRDLLVGQLAAKVLCCGENFRFGKNASGDIRLLETLCEEYGVTLRVVPAAIDAGEVISSTRIRTALAEGDLPLASRLLGRGYHIKQEVISGNQIGRTLGFPTLNQKLSSELCLPRYGVYLSLTQIPGDNEPLPSLTNIGVKPSIDDSAVPLAETYILEGTHDLYGQEVTVTLLAFLRPEMKFASLDALREQIDQDKQRACDYWELEARRA